MKLILKTTWLAALSLFLASGAWDAFVPLALGGGSKPAPQSKRSAPMVSSIPQAQAASSGSASISGKISLSGSVPASAKIKMNADPACSGAHSDAVFSQEVVANNGALKFVFVSVTKGVSGDFPAPSEPVVLDQVGCMYDPHVFGMQAGQEVEIRNSDGTLHNVNCQAKTNKKFNIAQPVKGMKTNKTFEKAEQAIPFKCNVHPWMKAYGFVVDHPFFDISGDDGSFKLANLPAGTYTVEAWHEKFGTKTQQVIVGEGESKTVDFSYSAS